MEATIHSHYNESVKCIPLVLILLCSWNVEQVSAGQNMWTPAGPAGGFFSQVGFSPVDSQILYAAADSTEFFGLSGGFFRSTDGGLSWSRFGATVDVARFCIDPADPSKMALATMGADAYGYSDIYRSSDAGNSWQKVSRIFFTIYDIEIDPANSSVLYAAAGTIQDGGYIRPISDGRIFKSIDGGVHWTGSLQRSSSSGLNDLPQVEISSGNLNVFALPADRKVYRSLNAAKSWQPVINGLAPAGGSTALEVSPVRPGTLFTGGYNGIFRTTDSGSHWSRMQCDCIVRQITADPADPKRLFATGEGLFISTDDGGVWREIPVFGMKKAPLLSVAIDPKQGSRLFVGGYGQGLFLSEDGGATWKRINGAEAFPAVALATAGNSTILMGSQQIWRATGADGWSMIRPFRARHPLSVTAHDSGAHMLRVNPSAPLRMIVCGKFDGNRSLAATSDGGKSWKYGGPAGICSTAALDPSNPGIIYVSLWSKTGVWKSTDFANSWTRVSTQLGSAKLISVDPQNPSRLIMDGGSKIYRSEDAGRTWRASSIGLQDLFTPYREAFFDPTHAEVVFLYNESYIYKSTDEGRSWRRKTNGLPFDRGGFAGVAMDPSDSNRLYLAGDTGIYRSLDNGENWTKLTVNGLPADQLANYWWLTCLAVGGWDRNTLILGTSTGTYLLTMPPP